MNDPCKGSAQSEDQSLEFILAVLTVLVILPILTPKKSDPKAALIVFTTETSLL